MKFLQLLCIALLLSAVLSAPLIASNATDAPLRSRDEKLTEFKKEIEKLKLDGKFEDRGWATKISIIADVLGRVIDRF
uniref:Secreted protein n=1 Tax=Panagrellus redivivus TaxID=6233 RepID=A0A7E4VWB8_PANRE